MARHALIKKHNFKKFGTIVAALSLAVAGLLPGHAAGGINISGQAGSFQSTFVNIASASRASNVITFNTVGAHHYQSGDVINTAGIDPSSYQVLNAVVTVVDQDTFTVASTGVDGAATISGNSLAVKTLKRLVINAISGNGTRVTVTTSQPHGLSAGAGFDIDDTVSSGSSFNVDGLVETATSDTFTYLSSNQSLYEGGAVALANLTGLNLGVNEVLYFYAVFVDNATPINAKVTMVAQADLKGTTGTLGQMDNLQDPQAGIGESNFLNSDIDFVTGAGDAYAELKIEFFTGTPGARTVVTLDNLYASVYDIDSSQYVQFSDFTSYFLSANSDLDVIAQGSVATRFKDGENESSSNPESSTTNRVTVLFESVSDFSYRIGKDRTGLTPNTSSAFYQLDLSPGWDVGGAWSAVRAPAVISPLLAKTVTFDVNSGTGSMSNQLAGVATALTSNGFTRSGFTFAGWNTAPDGSGTSYADGASFPFTASATLYAQWLAAGPVASTPYIGPLPVRIDISCLAVDTAGTAKLTGERLSTVTGATIGGKSITLSAISATSITLALPALAAGTYDVVYSSAAGSITHQDSLRVCRTSAPSVGAPVVGEGVTKPFAVSKRFSNYRGDRGPVVAGDLAAITAFIKANPGLTHVTCVGSTSGIPPRKTDPALAMARAKNACSVVEKLVPGVKIRLVANTGRGVGQFFRAVTLFGKGIQAN